MTVMPPKPAAAPMEYRELNVNRGVETKRIYRLAKLLGVTAAGTVAEGFKITDLNAPHDKGIMAYINGAKLHVIFEALDKSEQANAVLNLIAFTEQKLNIWTKEALVKLQESHYQELRITFEVSLTQTSRSFPQGETVALNVSMEFRENAGRTRKSRELEEEVYMPHATLVDTMPIEDVTDILKFKG